MSEKVKDEVGHFMSGLVKRNPGEPEFHQAVREVTESLMPIILDNPEYQKAQILERMTEPDRIIIFESPGRTTKAASGPTGRGECSSTIRSAPTREDSVFTPT
jgi:hypothetical protein